MNKLKAQSEEIVKEEPKDGFGSRLRSLFSGKGFGRATSPRALLYDLVILTLGFLFARCHVIFGAHPLGLAIIALLTGGVWQATLGVAIGALSLGADGIIFAVSGAIVAFLRLIVSSPQKEGEHAAPFGDSLLLRMSVASLGGFVSAVYEVLLSGFSVTSVLFGVSMVLLPPLLTFVFSGLFCLGISPEEFIFGRTNVFSLSGREDSERYGIIFFQISAAIFLFFASLSLAEIELLGISAAYTFISLVALLVSKRFGPLRALAVGFVSALGISATHAVSLALMGLSSGILFGFGTLPALVGGGAALSLWSAYSEGLMGVVSTLPEYSIAAVLSLPLLKSLSAEKTVSEAKESSRSAEEMVGSAALAYRSKYSASLDALESALTSIGTLVEESAESLTPSVRDYQRMIDTIMSERCKLCDGANLCLEHGIKDEITLSSALAEKLSRGERCRAEDVNTKTAFCQHSGEIAKTVNDRAAELERRFYEKSRAGSSAKSLELTARLIREARERDRDELHLAADDTEKCTLALTRLGLSSGVIRVFGERRRHLVLAIEDESGEKITSEELHTALGAALGGKLDSFEYFRRDKMALMECDMRPRYKVDYSSAALPKEGGAESGDTLTGFITEDGRFYSLISDGEGTGTEARDTSLFVSELLRRILTLGVSSDTVLFMLNLLLIEREKECSATVDLFELDLYSGEATFIKSGAAPSFVKRRDSVFRIRSKTAPIGIMHEIDSEKIRAEIKPDDTVIMLSDGIADSPEEAPWLLELLGKTDKRSTRALAELILAEARRRGRCSDDTSVAVIRILKEE